MYVIGALFGGFILGWVGHWYWLELTEEITAQADREAVYRNLAAREKEIEEGTRW